VSAGDPIDCECVSCETLRNLPSQEGKSMNTRISCPTCKAVTIGTNPPDCPKCNMGFISLQDHKSSPIDFVYTGPLTTGAVICELRALVDVLDARNRALIIKNVSGNRVTVDEWAREHAALVKQERAAIAPRGASLDDFLKLVRTEARWAFNDGTHARLDDFAPLWWISSEPYTIQNRVMLRDPASATSKEHPGLRVEWFGELHQFVRFCYLDCFEDYSLEFGMVMAESGEVLFPDAIRDYITAWLPKAMADYQARCSPPVAA
jgi:hypothetical protein